MPVGPYVADFACLDASLIIEIDGEQHGFIENHRHDHRRTAFLEHEGYRVLRFWNAEVHRELEWVLERIVAVIEGRE